MNKFMVKCSILLTTLFFVASLSFSEENHDDIQKKISDFESSVITAISEGKQNVAEELVDSAPNDIKGLQRFLFISANLDRSRFMVEEAIEKYNAVILQYPYNTEGYASYLIREMDLGHNTEDYWQELKKLADKNENNLWLRWMLCVEARNLNKNIYGEEEYRKLFSMIKVGSSLMHQTFANILDELGKHDEALKHRYTAIKLEDKQWSRDGLANTLAYLKRYDEAAENYKKAIAMKPNESSSRLNYALMLIKTNKYLEAEAPLQEATKITPKFAKAWYLLGVVFENEGKTDQAIENYNKALEIEPLFQLAIESLKRLSGNSK